MNSESSINPQPSKRVDHEEHLTGFVRTILHDPAEEILDEVFQDLSQWKLKIERSRE